MKKNDSYIIPLCDIDKDINICSIALRLIRPCGGSCESGLEDESGSGSGSGSYIESGKESGGQQSGGNQSSGQDCTNSGGPILFDRTSWSYLGDHQQLDAAATFWENRISFDPCVVQAIRDIDPDWNGITLNSVSEINTPGVAGAASVAEAIDLGGIKFNSLSFNLYINPYVASPDDLYIHELGHALGLGTLWTTEQSDTGQYYLDGTKYLLTQNAYNTLVGVVRNKIPIMSSSPLGVGANGGHWEYLDTMIDGESYPGIDNDTMAYTSQNGSITSVTTNFFLDIGYVGASLTIT